MSVLVSCFHVFSLYQASIVNQFGLSIVCSLNGLNQSDLSITCSSVGLNQFDLSIIYSPAGSPVYGSDYEEEARFTPNGPVTSSQPPYNSPENELLKQQLIDHHRDSPRPPFTQPQMVQGTTVTYANNYRLSHPFSLSYNISIFILVSQFTFDN